MNRQAESEIHCGFIDLGADKTATYSTAAPTALRRHSALWQRLQT